MQESVLGSQSGNAVSGRPRVYAPLASWPSPQRRPGRQSKGGILEQVFLVLKGDGVDKETADSLPFATPAKSSSMEAFPASPSPSPLPFHPSIASSRPHVVDVARLATFLLIIAVSKSLAVISASWRSDGRRGE